MKMTMVRKVTTTMAMEIHSQYSQALFANSLILLVFWRSLLYCVSAVTFVFSRSCAGLWKKSVR